MAPPAQASGKAACWPRPSLPHATQRVRFRWMLKHSRDSLTSRLRLPTSWVNDECHPLRFRLRSRRRLRQSRVGLPLSREQHWGWVRQAAGLNGEDHQPGNLLSLPRERFLSLRTCWAEWRIPPSPAESLPTYRLAEVDEHSRPARELFNIYSRQRVKY